jgi:predicted XRE-type DNA-binding protein
MTAAEAAASRFIPPLKDASLVGFHAPVLSCNLMNGEIDRFSIDKLVQMLTLAGMDIEMKISSQAA